MSTEMIDRVELTPFGPAPLESSSGNFWLIETLRRWGVTAYAGVNGGGLIHVAKHLGPFSDLSQATDGAPRMLTMGEYVAGFVPLGYYLASGRIAGCITTTGAATKLGGSGMTDAKLHNLPAAYLIALTTQLSELLQAPTVWWSMGPTLFPPTTATALATSPSAATTRR